MNPPWVYTCSPSWTPLPPPSPYSPSGSSQCTSPKHPVSCIEPGLAIHFIYDVIHVSMPFSQIIPPLPLPQSPKDCSYTSVFLLLSHTSYTHLIHLCLFCCLAYRVIVTIFLNIYALVYCIGEDENGITKYKRIFTQHIASTLSFALLLHWYSKQCIKGWRLGYGETEDSLVSDNWFVCLVAQ